MAVTRQQNKKWKVDISDGYDAREFDSLNDTKVL